MSRPGTENQDNSEWSHDTQASSWLSMVEIEIGVPRDRCLTAESMTYRRLHALIAEAAGGADDRMALES